MSTILLTLLLFALFLALIMMASLWYMRFWLSRLIGSKLADLETIAATGAVPQEWTLPYLRRMIPLQEQNRTDELQRLQKKARQAYARKLARLADFVKRTSLVESEEARRHTLQVLQRVAREEREAG
ncbi:hypothetical protein MJA45_17830 [Paenibacillus aurantius]|uniref:Uncharacterized protein n=1 Tax=Paenibacillus aurantius TaxID=2918900 RepID=A0AA96LAD7_9BACL|nr:hypothetical protein [Paenibacillus aurantius]WNQ09484.1 hypothetical protein MJA45_17830 [Paenibacillus aurantius]